MSLGWQLNATRSLDLYCFRRLAPSANHGVPRRASLIACQNTTKRFQQISHTLRDTAPARLSRRHLDNALLDFHEMDGLSKLEILRMRLTVRGSAEFSSVLVTLP